jgi:hypothetical protein
MLEGWRVLTTSGPSHYRKQGRKGSREGRKARKRRNGRKGSYQKALYNNPIIK